MSILQLNPSLPITCPKGKGYAFAMIDYSQEHNILFVCTIDDTGEIWVFDNTHVKLQKNISLDATRVSIQETLSRDEFIAACKKHV